MCACVCVCQRETDVTLKDPLLLFLVHTKLGKDAKLAITGCKGNYFDKVGQIHFPEVGFEKLNYSY